jgi:rod shape-determining protein MreD
VKHGFLFWTVALSFPILHFLMQVGFGWGHWAPDLLSVGLLLVARQVRTGTAAGLGFMFGVLEDAFSVLAFGANAMAMTVVGILGARSRDLFVGESLLFVSMYLMLGTWLRGAIHWIAAGDAVRVEAVRVLLVEAPISAVYAATVGTVLLVASGAWAAEAVR